MRYKEDSRLRMISTLKSTLLFIFIILVFSEVSGQNNGNFVNFIQGQGSPLFNHYASLVINDIRLKGARQELAHTVDLGGRKYLFGMKQVATWLSAEKYCDSIGMMLVSIESKAENDLIMSHIRSLGMNNQFIWSGGNKIGQSSYGWLSGEPVAAYTDWAPREPNLYNTEHCIMLWRDHWYDYTCATPIRFICEQPN